MTINIFESITTPIKLEAASPDLIKAVQKCVGVEDDGECGPITIAAFNQFKKIHHLGNPGIIGPTTAKKLLEIANRKITPETVLAIARSELGYKESPPGSNRSKFGAWYGMDAQPWCGMFVSYCFHSAGMPLQITCHKGFAYCPYGVEWFKKQGRFYKIPQPGDVVFFDWQRDGTSDHVGIVEAVNRDGTVTTIEGNTSASNNSNGGEVQRRVRSLNLIQGFGRPHWS